MDADNFGSPLPARKLVSEEVVNEEPKIVEERVDVPVVEVPKEIPKKKFPIKIVLAALLLMAVAGGALAFINKGGTSKAVTLTYWGLWEESSLITGVIEDYQKQNPNVKINYVAQTKADYRTRLAGRLEKDPETGDVPDIFRIHSSWMPMFKGKLAAVPVETKNTVGLETDFYNTVKKDLKDGSNYYAIPLMYDQLAMFYNKKLVTSAQVTVPKSWWELQAAAKKMTVRDEGTNRISVAGAAMGLTENVDHWSDIVGVMLKQAGANPQINDAENAKRVKDTLTFYTLFKTEYKVWDESLPASTLLFSQGKLGFYFAPSWRVFNIEDMKIGDLEYEIAPIPQLATNANIPLDSATNTADLTNIYWSTYWAEAVNSKSKKQKEAWKFLAYMASKEVLEKMYTTQSQVRNFGEIYPRKSMASMLTTNPKVAPFINNADASVGWYLSSRTFDDGLNDNMAVYFNDAINAMVYKNQTADKVWPDLNNGINQLVSRYQIK